MNDVTGLGIGYFTGWNRPTNAEGNARKINDGVEAACLEIVDRINRTKDSATDKELIDLSMCLSGLITAWNLSSLRAGYSAFPPITPCFGSADAEGGAS